jgi:hypothetical protein
VAGDPQWQSATILQILSDADPDGIGKAELSKLATEKGISGADLHKVLAALIENANIYFNASTRLYHFIWSSPLQWE